MTNKKVLDAVQTMAEKEYIEREALLTDEMTHTLPYSCGRSAGRVVVFVDDIEALPAADVVEVRHGEWLETQEPLGWRDVDCIECSVCHESWIMNEDSSIDDYECMWHHCPNCGAKMDERSKK